MRQKKAHPKGWAFLFGRINSFFFYKAVSKRASTSVALDNSACFFTE
ncbi:hypothetical protein SAMN04487891_103439 [Flagellimonas taeanensis]|uniref:Uncharacterized protein n=1 Tax=Flagellimonas taeanensis TaxID=1005926 RepID=A0A1M6U1T9_9FLAO|nr:hypothetical protein SAMN04487891_103439 [Allomuricauda taeanensis]SHK63114.1 hypothetical protein SAMN05216293_1597 [Allomuricauda taeanensis]